MTLSGTTRGYGLEPGPCMFEKRWDYVTLKPSGAVVDPGKKLPSVGEKRTQVASLNIRKCIVEHG